VCVSAFLFKLLQGLNYWTTRGPSCSIPSPYVPCGELWNRRQRRWSYFILLRKPYVSHRWMLHHLSWGSSLDSKLEGDFVPGWCEWHRLCCRGNLKCDSSVMMKDHWSHRVCPTLDCIGAAYEYVGWFPTTSEDCESWGTSGNETLVLSVYSGQHLVGWLPTTSRDCVWIVGNCRKRNTSAECLLTPASVKLDPSTSWFPDGEFYPSCEKLSQRGISEPFVARVS
jgi:hypothetical protein